MAFINEKWLGHDERDELIKTLRANIRLYRELMDADALTDSDLAGLSQDMDLLEKVERIHRGERDFLYFMYEYFSEERNPGNPSNLIPKGRDYDDAAPFHRELCGLLDDITAGKTKSNVAWSVGRGHAKTAYLSNGYLCHQVVYRLQKYIVEVSETVDVAGDFIQWTAFQLKYNRKLREDFGVLLHDRKSMNETDNKTEFITTSGTKVEAKGVQAQMRGLRHLEARPSLFLLDDLESRDNTNTPELRKKNRDWFTSEMLEALGEGGFAIYMGTIVHYDSLLNYAIKERKDFTARIFPAILEWSPREDLWNRWRELYRADEPDALEQAQAFFEANQEAMLAQTSVLWEQRFTYLDLIIKRENIGARAFNQEYLGNPVDEETQIFNPEDFTYYTEDELPDGCKFYSGVDFAMGKQRGDYSAIITIAESPNGVYYVVDTMVERIHPDILLERTVDTTLNYQLDGLAVEAQQAQEWFADKVEQELMMRGYPARTRMTQIKQRTRKDLRIEALLPDIQNGKIRFRKSDRLLLEMLELYPNHNHDDAPDALSMAILAARSGVVRVRKSRQRTR
jgi:predicted phage terminase large subunit-like protein